MNVKRIAKAKRAAIAKSGIDEKLARSGVIYFDIESSADEVETVARSERGEYPAAAVRQARVLLADKSGLKWLALEDKALRFMEKILKVKLWNEGHTVDGILICKFSVNSASDVRRISKAVGSRIIGGDDQVQAAAFTTAQGFRLYPEGVNRPSVAFDDWDEWLEENA